MDLESLYAADEDLSGADAEAAYEFFLDAREKAIIQAIRDACGIREVVETMTVADGDSAAADLEEDASEEDAA